MATARTPDQDSGTICQKQSVRSGSDDEAFGKMESTGLPHLDLIGAQHVRVISRCGPKDFEEV